MDFLLEIENAGKLYLGNSHDARNEAALGENEITAVVNVAKDLNDPWYDGIKYYKAGLEDGDNNDLEDYTAACFIVMGLLMRRDTRHNVLLHCHEGRSRTAAIAICVNALISVLTTGVKQDTTWGQFIEESIAKSKEAVCKVRPLCAKMNEQHEKFLPKELFSSIGRFVFAENGERLIK